jgi:phosphatidate cytidylyltransferase
MLKQRVITALVARRGFPGWRVLAAAAAACSPVCGGRRPGRLGVGAARRIGGWKSGRTLYVRCWFWQLRRLLYLYAGYNTGVVRDQIQPVLGLACLWWCFALLWVKSFPASKALWASPVMRLLMGMLILLPAWFAAVYLLQIEQHGAVMVVLVLIVAAADIGAYFTGRAFGRHALAPSVSPGKTWEGFWGGIVAVAALSVVLWRYPADRFDHLSLTAVMVVALATAFASVLGDLTVSMVKRERCEGFQWSCFRDTAGCSIASTASARRRRPLPSSLLLVGF